MDTGSARRRRSRDACVASSLMARFAREATQASRLRMATVRPTCYTSRRVSPIRPPRRLASHAWPDTFDSRSMPPPPNEPVPEKSLQDVVRELGLYSLDAFVF